MSPLNKNSLFTRIKLMETFDSAGEVGGSDNARSPTGHCDVGMGIGGRSVPQPAQVSRAHANKPRKSDGGQL